MTDRELLELAAKAAGITGAFQSAASSVFWDMSDDEHHVSWNPLADDGDALRLAVKLNFTVSTGGGGPRDPNKINIRVWCFGVPIISEPKGFDSNAATRRAIVRAAASIRKAKP